ncbi:MAG: TlpA family protein disulfide reductase [Dehalococcoidia bacterium]
MKFRVSMMNATKLQCITAVAALLLVALAFAGCSIRIHSPPELGLIETPNSDELPIGPFIGALAPNFRLETLEGDTLALSDLRGKPVFLNFFAVWCYYCRFETPEMEKVYQMMGDKVAIVSVDMGEPKKRVSAYREIMGLTFTMTLDESLEITRAYQVPAYPSTYLIDRDGVIRSIRIGAFLSEEEILGTLESLGFLTDIGLK